MQTTNQTAQHFWSLVFFLTWLALLLSVSSAEARCLEDIRSVELGDHHARLRTFVCSSDDNPQSPPVLRVEFHRLSDVAASTLVAGSNIQFVNEALGNAKILENEVYATFRQLVQRFSTERGRGGWGEGMGGVELSVETPKGGTGASPSIDQRTIA